MEIVQQHIPPAPGISGRAERDRLMSADADDENVPCGQAGGQPERSTSTSLMQRIRTNDPQSWQRLVELYRPLVFYWCGQWGCRRSDLDDVAQEVFLAVAGSLANFRRDRPGDTFRGWLRAVTRNILMSFFRRVGRQPQPAGGTDALIHLHALEQKAPTEPAEAPPDAPDPPVELKALRQRALELVRAEFEPRTWQMFWLSAVEGRPPVDIAAELGVGPATVRMAKSRVLRRLKEEFEGLID